MASLRELAFCALDISRKDAGRKEKRKVKHYSIAGCDTSEHPLMPIRVVSWRAIGKALLIFLIALVPILVTSIRRLEFVMRNRAEVIFNLMHVASIEPPVVIPKFIQ